MFIKSKKYLSINVLHRFILLFMKVYFDDENTWAHRPTWNETDGDYMSIGIINNYYRIQKN